MRQRINSSRRLRGDLTRLTGHGDSEIPRPSDAEVPRQVGEQAVGDSAPEPPSIDHPSEHWYG